MPCPPRETSRTDSYPGKVPGGGAELVKAALSQGKTVVEVAKERLSKGELLHLDDSRPVTLAELDAVFSDLRRLTEGGIIA